MTDEFSAPRPARPGAEEPTVADLGEFALIARSLAGRVFPQSTVVGPGDDAAVLRVPDGRIVVTTDMLVQDRHFRWDWSSPRDVGRKAVAQNGADVAAMGARCTGFVVAISWPADTAVSRVDELTDGLWEEAGRAGAAIVGGDVTGGDTVVLSITALGECDGRSPVLRSGAVPGDVVALSAPTGRSAAGLALLSAGVWEFPELLAAHRVPQPDYDAGPRAAIAGATAMCDVSDGLVAECGHLAAASGVRIDLDSDRLNADPVMVDAARRLGVDARDWVLGGGEDHALLATFPARDSVPSGWHIVGSVSAGHGDVLVDGTVREGIAGWTSF